MNGSHRHSKLRRGSVVTLCLVPPFLLAMAACVEAHQELLRPPPILIRNVVPRDSTVVSDQGGWPLSIDFRTPIEPGELKLRVVPTPDAFGLPTLSPSGLTLSIANVDLKDGNLKHRLLIDGPRLERPRVLEYTVGSPPIGSILGYLSTPKPAIARVDHAILFAYPESANIDPSAPESALSNQPFAIAKIAPRPKATVEAVWGIGSLSSGKYYLIIAIVDTNGDGEYDPSVDWWGYHHPPGDMSIYALQAATLAPLTGSIELRPPGPVGPAAERE
jgi:hypothetical protein